MDVMSIVNVCAMSNSNVDKKVKIAGTGWDRHCKVTEGIFDEMVEMRADGYTYSQIAEKFHLSVNTVRRHLIPEEGDAYRVYMRENFGKHTGKKPNQAERASYKRRLVLNNVEGIEVK